MKKFLIFCSAVLTSLCAAASPLQTADNPLGDLFNNLKNATGSNSGDGSSNSDLGNAISGLIGGLLSNDELTAKDFTGMWTYSGPAVCFQSENFLQKAGGSAAAATLEGKLAPYFTRFGLNKLVLTVDEELNFTMESGKLKAAGTITIEGSDVYFNFAALGKISLGKIKTYVVKSGSNLSIMFDISKLMNIVKSIGSAINNSTINTITGLLDSYDGICAGFKLHRQ